MYFNFKYFLVLLFSLFINISVAEEIRDYYAEPGLNPFKETMQDLNESIDPFSGTLQQKYTDIVIPGNGGLDIRINRTYTSPQDVNAPGTASAYGVGWTIHFGRIVTTKSNADKLCNQAVLPYSTSTMDNPSLELPDGGRELLVHRDVTLFPELDVNELITRSNWKAQCASGSGLVVTSPTGTVYTMNEYAGVINGSNVEPSWFTSRIEDTNGNWIAINYVDRPSSGYKMIDEITSSDGRIVKFNYIYPSGDLAHLDTITAHYLTADEQTWHYNYVSVNGVGAYQLVEVVRPDGNNWQYDYKQSTALIGKYAMSQVTYPQGGIVDYTYDHVIFNPGAADQINTTVISSKTTSGNSVTPGTWTYDYAPGSYLIPNSDRKLDVTTVTTPTSIEEYYHNGAISQTYIWAMGLLSQKLTYDVTGTTLLDAVINVWDGRKISDENYWHGRSRSDIGTYTPILLTSAHWQDGFNYETTYNNYDRFGNPAQIIESGNYQGDRITDYLYYTDPVNWIIVDKISSETIQGIGSIVRNFNADGTLKDESKYGVLTEYTYHPTGDLATVTDARGRVKGYSTQFNDYHRGIAQEEIHPVSVVKDIITKKVINATGTVKSKTNGRGYTTSFTYDKLNRLKTITYPKIDSAPVSIDYTATSKTLTRGNLQQSSTVNGFGQTVNTTINDTLNNIIISTTQEYDAIGQLIFKSHPNNTIGTSYQYDGIGRQTRIDHPDSTFRTIEYLDFNDTRITDERGKQTTYSYRAFSNPSEKSLVRIVSPESITTAVYRNKIDQIDGVWQGRSDGLGYARTYTYNSNRFLESITHPETGVTQYGRDEIGNMTSKRVGYTSNAIYSYDFQNRNTYIDYPNYRNTVTEDVKFDFDENGNSTLVENLSSIRTYLYDENDNLKTETIKIGETTSLLEYFYTSLDYLNTIIYPSGKDVNYLPDALGRPTQMEPYLSSIKYYPSGQTKQLNYANGQITDFTLNNRLWVEGIHVGNVEQNVSLTYGYDGLGNVETITDSVTPSNDRLFTYDDVNRLISASGQWGAGSYYYDWWGNIQIKKIGTHDSWSGYPENKLGSVNRKVDGSSFPIIYDLYGNITRNIDSDFIYDGASQLVQSYRYGNLSPEIFPATNYLYDGNGMRINSINGLTSTNYVFSSNGNLMREYGAHRKQEKEYFYLGSQQIAMVSNVPDSGDVTSPIITTSGDITVEATGRSTDVLISVATATDNIDTNLVVTADNLGPFSLGTHTITWSTIDSAGNPSYAKQSVTVTDTTPPSITQPVNRIVEATGRRTIISIGTPKAIDLVHGYVSVSLRNYKYNYTLGTHTLYWDSTDYSGNTSTVEQLITVVDTTAPVITVPADILINSTGELTSVNLGSSTAFDLVDGVLVPTPDNIGPYPIGKHTVTWSVTDNAGNTSNATQIVNIIDSSIIDTSPPIITIPTTNMIVEATGPLTSVNLGEVTAVDIVSGILPVTPDQTGPFSIGTHSITWSATDASGNVGTAIQTVIIADTTAPIVYPPSDLTIEAKTDLTHVDFSRLAIFVYAKDIIDGNNLIVTPNNVGPFELGEHIITWSATDAAGNTGIALQTITVHDTTGPTIILPEDVTITVIKPERIAIDIGQATATDVFGVVSLTNDAPDNFGIGITRVFWTATDSNGNISRRFQLVTVIYAPANSSWSSPTDLFNVFSSTNIIMDLKVVKSDNGYSMALWQEYNNISNTSSIWTAHYTVGNGWATPIQHFNQTDPINSALIKGSSISAVIDMNSVGDASIAWVENSIEEAGERYSAPNENYPDGRFFPLQYLKTKKFSVLNGWGAESQVTQSNNFYGEHDISFDDIGNIYLVWSQPLDINSSSLAALHGTVYKPNSGWGEITSLYAEVEEMNPDLVSRSAEGEVYRSIYESRRAVLSKNNTGKILLSWMQDAWEKPQLYSRYYDSAQGWSVAHHDSSLSGNHPLQDCMNNYVNENNQGVVLYRNYHLKEIMFELFNVETNTWSTPQRAYDENLQEIRNTCAKDAGFDEKGNFIWVGTRGYQELIEEQNLYTNLMWAGDFNNSTGVIKNQVLYGFRGRLNSSIEPTLSNADKGSALVTWRVQQNNTLFFNRYDSTIGWYGPRAILTVPTTTRLYDSKVSMFDNEDGLAVWIEFDGANYKLVSSEFTSGAAASDTTPPVVTPPINISIEATAQLTTLTLEAAAANDDVDGTLTATADNTGPFAVGTHTITWSATDAAGNTGTATQTIIVTDTIGPTVNVSTSQTVEATGPLTPITLGTATATDLVDGAITPTPSLNSPFSVGTHIVIWTATDTAGNMGSAAQLITVVDTTAPVINVPTNITIEATGSLTTVSLGSATASDLVDGTLTPTADNIGPYTVGTHTVTWSATDTAGNVGTATQTVTITDTTSPVITTPASISVEATGPLTSVTLGTVYASDLVDGSLLATANNIGPFAVGTHTITWSVTDAAGNVSSATQLVTITDTTGPVVLPPDTITIEATGALTNVTLGTATAIDLVEGNVIPSPNTIGPFAVGIHNVIWRATDSKGNLGTATQTVTITDTTVPVLSVPAAITVEANAVLTIVDLGIAAANDIVDGVITPVADNTGPYSVGVHTITWSATDVAGNVVTATQTVTVNDTAAPVLTLPDDITLESAVPLAIDIGAATATDIFIPVSMSNNPPVEFPLGITTVTWTATDIHSNSVQGVQYISVTEPAPVTSVRLSTNLSSPQFVGAEVEVSALLKGANANYEFEFSVLTLGSPTPIVIQRYSRSPYVKWNTTEYEGANKLQVQARLIGSTATPISGILLYRVNALPSAKTVTLTSDLASPQPIGSKITLTGSASGGSGNYEYKFQFIGANSKGVTLQDWSSDDTVTWDTQGYLGVYLIQVLSRNAGSTDKPALRVLSYRLK